MDYKNTYITLKTEVKDGVRTITNFETNGEVLKQNDLTIILHALSRVDEPQDNSFAYTFGMSF